MSTSQTPITNEELLQQIQAGVVSRINQADTEAYEADLSFAVGKFGEYFQHSYEQVEGRIQDEYDKFFGQTTDGGNSEESSGGGGRSSSSSEGVSTNENEV